MFSSEPPEEKDLFHNSTVTLKDEAGRTLECYVERSLFVDDQEYLLLLPVDSAVEIFVWQGEEEEEEAIPLEDEAEIDQIFDTAEAVLAEQNLILKRTAFALTVAGELPSIEETEVFTLEVEDEEGTELEPEQLQLLASFYYEEQEYAIYTPLDPLLFFARTNSSGQPVLLSPEEMRQVQPLLEEQLFDELE